MKRSFWFWLCFVVSIILATYFSVRIIMTALGHGNVAHVHNISISADMRGPELGAVAAAAAVAPGAHSYSVDLDTLAARVSDTPGVRMAAVRRMPNGNISVRVKMYRAVAQWTDGDAFYPLSADGTIVRRPSDARDPASVLFRGALPDDISEITDAARNMTRYINYLEWIENRRWNIITTDDIKIMLPEDNPTAAIATLMMLQKKHDILSRDIHVIDMRDDARILVK
ncbi:hypothetical protein HDR61_01750 [bacterium]|nr:hypothetical protein [bacterium]